MKTRPIGVIILSIISIASGILMNLILISTYSGYLKINQINKEISTSLFLFFIIFYLINFITGVGMWFGKTWSWHTQLIYHAIRAIGELTGLIQFTKELTETNGIWIDNIVYKLASFFVTIIIIKYLLKPKVINYFKISKVSKGRIIFILVIAVLISVILNITKNSNNLMSYKFLMFMS